jgi:hypothetical protein
MRATGAMRLSAVCFLTLVWRGFMGTVDDAVLVTRGVFGDFNAATDADARKVGTLHNLTALLNAVRMRGQLSEPDLDALLEWAEAEAEATLTSGELTSPRVRNGEVGPWDASEEPVPTDTERIDYGVLKVPYLAGAETRPLYAGERTVGVIISFGGNDFCLQLFRAPQGAVWEVLRPQIMRTVRDQGGTAVEKESSLGPEIRAEVPGVLDGQQGEYLTRLMGCDGPGWLLRGVYRGAEALADVVDPRAYHLFTQTVVDLSDLAVDDSEEVTAVDVRWPSGE